MGRKGGVVTPAELSRIALALPGVEKVRDRLAFGVRTKGKLKEFAWVWMERVAPKKPRVPNPRVLAVRVPTLAHKERLLGEHPSTLFTEPHYDGFPAVLVRLDTVRVADLRELIREAWRCLPTPPS
jgi:hypothetical protein